MPAFFIRLYGGSPSDSEPLPVTFDEAVERLSALDRMFVEPDGSFVWRGVEGDEAWQIEGQLVDGGLSLAHVELKGSASVACLQRFIDCLQAERSSLWVEQIESGVAEPLAVYLQRVTETSS